MNKFQKLQFHSVSDFLNHLPPHELEIVEKLLGIILDAMPDATEKLAYNVPFYYLNKRVCYIWPSSVPWGGITEGVSFGFCQAMLFEDLTEKLAFGNKKEIGTLSFHQASAIDEGLIWLLLKKAKVVDDELGRQ